MVRLVIFIKIRGIDKAQNRDEKALAELRQQRNTIARRVASGGIENGEKRDRDDETKKRELIVDSDDYS